AGVLLQERLSGNKVLERGVGSGVIDHGVTVIRTCKIVECSAAFAVEQQKMIGLERVEDGGNHACLKALGGRLGGKIMAGIRQIGGICHAALDEPPER